MSLHFAYGRSTLSSSDWDITVNTGGGDLTGASKYFSLQAQNPVGKNLILVSSLVVFQTGDSITFTINDTALTEAEGWTHYVIGISDTSTPSTFNQIARINIYDMSTGAVDFNTQNTFPLDLTITKDEQLNTGVFVDDKLSLPVADLLYGMRRGVTENNYIYEYNPFSTLTPNNDDVLSGTGGVWLKKEEFTNYIASVSQYGGCGYDIYHLTNFSQVELPTYNADGTNSFRVKYYLLNNSGFTLQPGTGFTLAAQIGGVERTELFDGKISYRFNGIVTPTTGTLRKVNSVTGQTLDFIDKDFVYTKANPVTISKDYIEHNTGIYFDVHVNFLSLEFNNLLPEGYLQIFFSYISPKGVFTPVGTLFEKGIIFNKYNKRRVLADTGLNVVVGEGEGLIKNFAWYSCNTSISGLAANTANQKLYVNINGVVFVDIAERTSSILRAVVDTTAKESIASPWSAYSAVSLNSALVVTVDYDCDSDLNLQIRDTYPDVIAGDWGIFNPTKLTIYVQRQSDGQIRKFTNFIPAGSNPSQNFTITDWSVGTVVGSVPSTSASFFDPITNSFSTTLGAGNFAADSYRVAHTYVWNGDTVSDISHSVALGCVTESQINGEEVFGITNYGTISEIKDVTELYDGKSLYCNATDQNYFYDANSTETEDNYFVLEPTSGVGRWLSVAKGTVRLFKSAVAPTISNDISEGYLIGDKWLDTVEEKEYTLVDNTDGAAVWKQVGGGANETIILSADVTWYVSPTGDANADGLTVGTPITLEEAADRVFTVVPTGKYYTITIELADGTYNYANDYRFVHPDTLFSFDIKLHGADWVGLTAYPTVDISNRQIYFKNFQGYSYIENVYYGTLRLVGSSFDIKNVATTNICRITEYYGYAYVNGFYKFGGVGGYAFYITGGYLDLDGVTFDAGGTTRNFTQGFIRIGYTGGLSLSSPNTITGTFTGKKIDFINAEAILDGDEANFATIPGDIEPVYPTYIFAPSNTLATTTSLSTVATSGSYNDLTDKPTIPTTAAGITVDTTNLNVNLSGADNTVQKAIETLDELVAGGGGLTVVYTTDVTIVPTTGNAYLLNGTTTVNLPVGVDGERIGFADYAGNFLASPVTINANGTDTIAGLASVTLDRNHACIELAFHSGKWVITSLESFDDSVGGGLIDGGAGVTLDLTTEPSSPSAGKLIIYGSSIDGSLYTKNNAGVVTPVGASVISDSAFRIKDNTDATKQVAFEVSGITTGTTRTLSVLDASGTITTTDTLTDKSLYYYDTASKLLKPIPIGTVDQVLVAKPSLSPPYQFVTPSTGGREVLTADRTYYVRTDGSDSNNGLTNTAVGAFLTIQKALNVVSTLDTNGRAVIISVGSGTYSESVIPKPITGGGSVTLLGNPSSPENVIISAPSGTACFDYAGGLFGYILNGFTLNAASVSFGLAVYNNSILTAQNLRFGTSLSSHIRVLNSVLRALQTTFTVTGAGGSFINTAQGGVCDLRFSTINFVGSLNFSSAVVTTATSGNVDFGGTATFSGSATGTRYSALTNSTIIAASNAIPGSVAGTTATGGQYV